MSIETPENHSVTRDELKDLLIERGYSENEAEVQLIKSFDKAVASGSKDAIEQIVKNIKTSNLGPSATVLSVREARLNPKGDGLSSKNEDIKNGDTEERREGVSDDVENKSKHSLTSPEYVNAGNFIENFNAAEYRDEIRENMSQREGMIGDLVKVGKLTVSELKKLEQAGIIEGYTVYKTYLPTLKGMLERVGTSPVDGTVAGTAHELWSRYINASESVIRTLREHLREQVTAADDVSKIESTTKKREETQTSNPSERGKRKQKNNKLIERKEDKFDFSRNRLDEDFVEQSNKQQFNIEVREKENKVIQEYLSYQDIEDLSEEDKKRILSDTQEMDSAHAYARSLEDILKTFDREEIAQIVSDMKSQCSNALEQLGVPVSSFGESDTWAYWDIAKQHQHFVNEKPDQTEYAHAEWNDPSKIQEIIDRHIGWEFFRYIGEQGVEKVSFLVTDPVAQQEIMKMLQLPKKEDGQLRSLQYAGLGNQLRTYITNGGSQPEGDQHELPLTDKDFVASIRSRAEQLDARIKAQGDRSLVSTAEYPLFVRSRENLLRDLDAIGDRELLPEESEDFNQRIQELVQLHDALLHIYRPGEAGGSAELSNYEDARLNWKEARDRWKEVKQVYEKKYRESLSSASSGETEEHTQLGTGERSLEDYGLEELKVMYLNARKEYFMAIHSALGERAQQNLEGDDDSPDSKQALFTPNSEGIQKAVVNRLVLQVAQERLRIEKEVAREERPEALKRAERIMAALKKRRWWIRAGIGTAVVIGAAVAFPATAGAAATAGAIAGGGYALRVAAGMAGAMAGGYATNKGYEFLFTKKKRDAVAQSEATAQREVSADALERLESNYYIHARSLAQSERNKRYATTAGAIGGGMLAGTLGHDAIQPEIDINKQGAPYQGVHAFRADPDGTWSDDPRPQSAPEQEKQWDITEGQGDIVGGQEQPMDIVEGGHDIVGGHEAVSSTGYTVEKGNNLWNILEGEGPDAHPVGGHSAVLEGMPENLRNHALNVMVKFMEDHPEFTKSVGVTSGVPGDIHPGEVIDVARIDEKMMELLQNDERYAAFVPQPEVPDIDSGQGVISPNPEAQKLSAEVPSAPSVDAASPVRGVTADQNIIDSENLPRTAEGLVGGDSGFQEASFTPGSQADALPQEAITGARQSIISSIEPQKGFFNLLGTDISGTFDKLQNMKFSEMIAMSQLNPRFLGDRLAQLGITEKGWNAWVDAVNRFNESIPARQDQTLGQYIDSVAQSNITNKTVET